jgi:FixJ family two-component response regulator
MTDATLVHVVDDDDDVLRSLTLLLGSVGIPVRTYSSGDRFLRDYRPAPQTRACLLLDVRMPGLSGMSLLEKLHAQRIGLPVIMLTGHGDIPMSVQAMKLGAVDFLTKPFNHQRLLDLVQDVLRDPYLHEDPATREIDRTTARARWELLTAREREVFDRIVSGASNKIVASDLEISPRTVETHRARIMEKLQARTLVDLVMLKLSLTRSIDAP